ncbi:MAG: hypothetical protein C0596_18890 [Marinilabiliales bacterium]|nr:MAG: hypothetical protein C0596_18890 [Marinilabiliales bacterium]
MDKKYKILAFYFTGTGNAKAAAEWIGKYANERSVEAEIFNIDELRTEELPKINKGDIIGIISPTHGFNLPPVVLRFISRLPKSNKNKAFIINTRAGMKLHKLFLPGLSGIAQYWTALRLKFKSYEIIGMQPLDMPSNWLIIHPGIKQNVVKSIFNRCETKIEGFVDKILNGKKVYKALLSLPFDLAVLPVSILYFFVGRFFLAKTMFANFDCNSCRLCEKKCPVNAIKIIDKRPFWTFNCESCMRCVNICPQRAIETSHSFVAMMIVTYSLVISPLILLGISKLDFINADNLIIDNLISIIAAYIFLTIMMLSYYIVHFLLRFRFFNAIMTYTSLSKFKFWRRYKGLKE